MVQAKTKRPYRVGVFVEPGKQGWKFRAYLRGYNPDRAGCNIVVVLAKDGKDAKAEAIQAIKNRMDLRSKIPPSSVRTHTPGETAPK